MTQLFADRMFVTVNGYSLLFLKSANITRNMNLHRASHMTATGLDSGFKRGNKAVQVALSLDIAQNAAQFDIAIADPTADVNLVAECGGERYTIKGLAESDMKMQGSVGDAGKDYNFEALDIVNENGDSVNVNISL